MGQDIQEWKCSLPQVLLGPFLNTLTHIKIYNFKIKNSDASKTFHRRQSYQYSLIGFS